MPAVIHMIYFNVYVSFYCSAPLFSELCTVFLDQTDLHTIPVIAFLTIRLSHDNHDN